MRKDWNRQPVTHSGNVSVKALIVIAGIVLQEEGTGGGTVWRGKWNAELMSSTIRL